MSDVADNAAEAAVSTPGDEERDPELAADVHQTATAQQASEPAATDSKPRRGRPRGSKNKPRQATGASPKGTDSKPERSEAQEVRKLKKRLNSFLVGPAVVFDRTGDEWAAQHVEAQAPELSKQLIALGERDPEFGRRLKNFLSGGETAALTVAAFSYVMPLALYFGMPFPETVRRGAGIPRRSEVRRQVATAPSREEMAAEALEHGYEDPDEYVADVQRAYAEAGRQAAMNVYREPSPDEPDPEEEEAAEEAAEPYEELQPHD